MQCPSCRNVALVMAERQGVEIDYCPSCRGIWLDRGELDKIIERSEAAFGAGSRSGGPDPRQQHQQPPPAPPQAYAPAPPMAQPPMRSRPLSPDDSDHYGHVYHDHKGRPVYPKKRKSIWREIFDFD